MKSRNIIYITISIICIFAIILGVYYQIFANKVVDKPKNETQQNSIDNDEPVDDPEDLLTEFNKLFTNDFYSQGYSTSGITKMKGLEEKDIICTYFNVQQDKEDEYSVDLKLPVFNIQGQIPSEYNNATQSIFVNKANAIFTGTRKYTVYNVEYVGYLNDNILSLVIKSTLKEGDSAQRIIVQTYNYNIETNKKVTLNEVLEKENIKQKDVNKKIERQVKEAGKQAEEIAEATGQIVYKRDINSAMYITDNVSTFFIGKDGQIYIIYPYGNNNVTSEIDIIKL